MRVNYPAACYDADDVMRINHREAEYVAEVVMRINYHEAAIETDDVTTNGSKTSDVIEIY